ncbi:cellulase family glycosylhydrolase [Sphingomonas yantingensis]|uniref:Ca2+-binding RTX toxin-like protein n=1 Tax=Sphingomonas yantingensis TaxID=1241761 RepID=A0A7W9ARJ3_9SPHN|nr:cellulase family glycosylhydrolase [Sphingomonas yantingensis]MBB5699295.1 Ca2+-binding RTX toxin-like protein [Sphingomonas yantingensis]
MRPSGLGKTSMLGINLSGAEFGKGDKYGYDYIYPSSKDLKFYADQGLTLVRLPVRWERLQPELGGSLDAVELGRLNTFLVNAAKAGVQVIVDVHNYGRYDGKVIGSPEVPIASFADFWSKLAGAIGSSSALLGYDLMNEPHDMPNKTIWPQAAQAATDAIRALGDTRTIFVEGEHWANATNWAAKNPFLDVKDPLGNLVYEAHVYFDKDGSGTYKGTYDQEGAYVEIGAQRLKSFVGWLEAKGAKGFIGEFGVPSDDPRWQAVLDHFLATLNDYGLSGTYWGAGSWFNGYKLGLVDKKGAVTASLDTLLSHVADGADVGIGAVAPSAVDTASRVELDGIVRYVGTAGHDVVDLSASGDAVIATLDGVRFVSIEELIGGRGNDVLTGDGMANRLRGGDGNDWLDGRGGADMLVGGAGDDLYFVDHSGDEVIERVGEGRDQVIASIDWTLDNSIENLTLGGAAVQGTGNGLGNVLIGNALNNRLIGLGGDDVLDGGAGADTLTGGTGNDRYVVDNIGDVVIERSKEGFDTVVASLNWTLNANVEHLSLVGAERLTGTGNALDNRIDANDAGNILIGGSGDDTLTGGAGADRLDGGSDEDTLIGGAGDDILIGGLGRDWLTGGAGNDRFVFLTRNDSKNAGMDRILDFVRGEDLIDLSAVDANTRASGNQSFAFIGAEAFGKRAGQLRYDTRDDYTVVQADLDGDGVADIAFRLESFVHKLAASDFLL